MPTGGGDGGLQNLQKQQQAALTKGGAAIEQSFSQFNPQFYQNAQQAYTNYAMPQVGQQYRTTAKNLGFQLANKGLVKSSAGQQLGGSLRSELANAQQQVANQGQSFVQGLQQNVAGQKSQLYSQLQSSLNPTATAQNAANLAAQTAAPSSFAPIGQLFNNWSSQYLANQQAQTYNPLLMMPWLNQQSGGSFAGLPKN